MSWERKPGEETGYGNQEQELGMETKNRKPGTGAEEGFREMELRKETGRRSRTGKPCKSNCILT